jgi:hypothetical protein
LFQSRKKKICALKKKIFKGFLFSQNSPNVLKGEFLCPLCRRLSNALLPEFSVENLPTLNEEPVEQFFSKKEFVFIFTIFRENSHLLRNGTANAVNRLVNEFAT